MLSEQTQEFPEHLKDGRDGDCYRAAIACLLEMSIADVPHFMELYPVDGSPDWFEGSKSFVEEHVSGWTLCCIEPTFPSYVDLKNCPPRVIVAGKSPRGDWDHAVMADSANGVMTWDPHPAREGIESQKYVIALTEK